MPIPMFIGRECIGVQSVRETNASDAGRENPREEFRLSLERRKFPALPLVVTKALGMLGNPDLNIRVLCRVLSDDPALTAKILGIARSAFYGQRTLPTTLQAAVQIIGLRDLRNVIVSVVTQGFFKSSGPAFDKLWSHSLGVALSGRMLSSCLGHRDPEKAFLAGLLHDVGQMIFLHGDRESYLEIVRDSHRNKTQIVEGERMLYGFDHVDLGVSLLEAWHIEAEIGDALRVHHEPREATDPTSLGALLKMAEYLAFRAGFDFYFPVQIPAREILHNFAFENEEVLAQAIDEVRQASVAEIALLKAV